MLRDSKFLDLLKPFDQLMARRGFNTKTDPALKKCYLIITQSAAKGRQMVKEDVYDTSNIANVRVYGEQAI